MILPDATAIATEAADRLVVSLGQAVARDGVGHVALTGGSSAAALYARLGEPEQAADLDWSPIHLWWGDERYVPIDHPDSNAGSAAKSLTVPITADHVHPVPVDMAIEDGGPAVAAARYAEAVRAHVPPAEDGTPAFDVVLLGVGPDGHILSVFPGSPALDADSPLALAIDAPAHVAPHVPRVTLSPRILAAAGCVIVMVPGASKAAIVAQVMGEVHDPHRWPAQLALRTNATWLLDRESAAQLA